jgi:hypothetical protein
MRDTVRWHGAEEDQQEADRQTASLAGLAFSLFLVVVSLFLVRTLHAKCAVEDCLLAGHSNCDSLVAAPPSLIPRQQISPAGWQPG